MHLRLISDFWWSVEKTDVDGFLRSHRKDIRQSYILPISLQHPSIGDTSDSHCMGTGQLSSDDPWHCPNIGEFFLYIYRVVRP